MADLTSLQDALGVSFNDESLLRLALVHDSFLNENPGAFAESNERLEYLGDAVLGLIVAHELFNRHPDWAEGDLTWARAEVVNGGTLAQVATGLELGELLYIGKGEEKGGGRRRSSNMAAAFEAVVGAVLVDRGYEAARASCLAVLSEAIDAASSGTGPHNPKSKLQELVQRQGRGTPAYSITDVAGEDHLRTFTAEVAVGGQVAGRGTGRRKAEAEQAAARAALGSE